MVHHIDDSIRMYPNCLHHRPGSQHHQLQRMNSAAFATSGSVARTVGAGYYGYQSSGVPGLSPAADEAISPGLRHPQSTYVDSHVAARHMQHQYYPSGVEVYHPNQSVGAQSGVEHMTQQQQQHGSPTGGGTPSVPSWMFATSPDGQGGSNDSGAGSPDWPSMCNRYNGNAGSFRPEENMDLMSTQHQDRSPPGDGTYTYLHRLNVDQPHHLSLTPANTSTVSPMHDSVPLTGNVNVGAAGLHGVSSAVRRQLQNEPIRSHSGNIGSGGSAGVASSDWGNSPTQQQHGAPYDWMKKQTYPAITPSGTCMMLIYIYIYIYIYTCIRPLIGEGA